MLMIRAALPFLALKRVIYTFRMLTNSKCYPFDGAVETMAKTLIKSKLGLVSIGIINKGDLLTRTISCGTSFYITVKSLEDRGQLIFFEAIRKVADV